MCNIKTMGLRLILENASGVGFCATSSSVVYLRMMNSTIFSSPTFGQLDLKGVIDHIVGFIEAENNCTFKIVVGTDSELIPHGGAHFVTAIVVHHVGHGGIYFWSSFSKSKIKDLRQRMYEEATQSLTAAQELIGEFKKRDLPLSKIVEIHVDVGQNGDTRNMIAEITGMVRGSGFVCKTKPESFGASNVADRHT